MAAIPITHCAQTTGGAAVTAAAAAAAATWDVVSGILKPTGRERVDGALMNWTDLVTSTGEIAS